jgi:flagellar biosynthesis/type III secretory pathway M-ring protein FliF/YscJ
MPPALEAQGDVIGEADEGEMAMPGIEVGEDEMQSQKMLEQVGELVTQSPEAAAKLIGRWINVED